LEKEGAIIIVNHTTYLEPPSVYLLFVLFWYKATIKAAIAGMINLLSFKLLTIEDLGKEVENRLKDIERSVPVATVNKEYSDLPHPLIVLVKNFAFARVDKDQDGVYNRGSVLRQLVNLLRKEKRSIIVPAEGTRTFKTPSESIKTSPKGNKLGPFEPGAAFLARLTGIPLTPIGIIGTENVLPNGKLALPLLFVAYVLPILPGKGTIEINIGFPCPISKKISVEEANENAMKSMMTTLDEITQKREN
jgi:1-acyl-sn-glycerol-3-phosphate acyltransferase